MRACSTYVHACAQQKMRDVVRNDGVRHVRSRWACYTGQASPQLSRTAPSSCVTLQCCTVPHGAAQHLTALSLSQCNVSSSSNWTIHTNTPTTQRGQTLAPQQQRPKRTKLLQTHAKRMQLCTQYPAAGAVRASPLGSQAPAPALTRRRRRCRCWRSRVARPARAAR